MSSLEMSRYAIPWTPFRRKLDESMIMLVSTAGVYQPPDAPFELEGDLSFRRIDSARAAADLKLADAHYDHGCTDVDLNCVFPTDRLRELAAERRIGSVAAAHFSTGFVQALREFKEKTVPVLVAEVVALRPDAVLLTGG